ncbi:MAG: tRNA lysidine(34) synthetase TilS [Candidatus Tectomicrobia bacterium]|uniref:tRNA(Ile)-lysidine synthase n=1 Tax=Tectimicrobiota bacterium TaxID=2528274 RepID=A0A932GPT2_UNCTE|nr:tRNA lysidine(34) synthetase TilS [Candidatus Tectomicrobia bacterium]
MFRTITRHGLVVRGDRVLVAVSGGPDSMALLESLYLLRERLSISLSVAHLDHALRGSESARDARFVQSEAEKRGLPFVGGKEDVIAFRKTRRCSLEEAAREVRYRFLRDSAASLGAQRIALGHTASDQAETVLLNLLRGSGRRGLAGMPAVRQGVWIRPLLNCLRAEVEDFLKEQGIPFVLDPTNALRVYRRNRIRHDLLPKMEEEFGPGVTRALARSAELLAREEEFLEARAREALRDVAQENFTRGIALRLEKLQHYPLPIRSRVLRLAAGEAGLLGALTFRQVESLLNLAGGTDPSGEVALPRGLRAQREYGLLHITVPVNTPENVEPSELPMPGVLELPWCRTRLIVSLVERGTTDLSQLTAMEALFDAEALVYPLRVRNRAPGDRFEPLGGPGGKKLKEYFIDEKIPRRRRDFIPLVLSGERILWVVGRRLSSWARPTGRTRHLLRIRAEIMDTAVSGDGK